MDLMDLKVIATSGVVSAAVAGIFKLWSDIDQSRRTFLSGVLTEAYKREAAAYQELWKEMFALQESAKNFLTTYSQSIDEIGQRATKQQVEDGAKALLEAIVALTQAMDKNRPFFHDDVYDVLKSYTEYTQEHQWMATLYPALHNIQKIAAGIPPEEFDYLKSMKEMEKRIEEVSNEMRKRMIEPEEALLGRWTSFIWRQRIRTHRKRRTFRENSTS